MLNRVLCWIVLTDVVLFAIHGCTRPAGMPAVTPSGGPELPAIFVDRTTDTGIQFAYRNGEEAGHFSILETLGGGVALIDFDKDGLLDIFLTGGGYFDGPDRKTIRGHPSRLYKNLGGWKFKDVTAEVGLDRPLFYTHGAQVADYDNDGWPDLLVTGWGRLALYHNEADGKSGRRFVEVSARAGLTDTLWSTSAAWADFNGDGLPDLYVCHYVDWSFDKNPPCTDYQAGKLRDVCPPKQFDALPHILYLNNGDGTFRDASKQAGLRVPRMPRDYDDLAYLTKSARQTLQEADDPARGKKEFGKGLGVIAADFNDDGKPDIYVANDTVDNFLYLNKGDARFEEVGVDGGVARDDHGRPNGSMGIDVADYDGSGQLSIWVTNYQQEAHALYRNRGNGQFVHASRSAGTAAIGLTYVGFGTGFIDIDRDGAEDIFIANGHVVRHPPPPAEVSQYPVLLRNLRKPGDQPHQVRFEIITQQGGGYFQAKHHGRGAAFADLDNDGKIDIVISHLNEPVAILQGALENQSHWLGIELLGKNNRDTVGARLTLERQNLRLVRTIKGGGSYLSSNDPRVVFGLGTVAASGRLTVRWPSGVEQSWDGLGADQYWRLREGQANAEQSTRDR